MDESKLTGLLVSFFNEASVFYEILQRKRNHKTIGSLEAFVSNLQNTGDTKKSQFDEILLIITNAVRINPNNTTTSWRQFTSSLVMETLFRNILSIPCFVTWESNNGATGKTGSYFLYVPVPPCPHNQFHRASKLLEECTKASNGAKMANPPSPALVIRLFREGNANVLPSLQVNVDVHTNDQFCRRTYFLQTVVCLSPKKELMTFYRQQNSALEFTWKCLTQSKWNRFEICDMPEIEKSLQYISNFNNLDMVPTGQMTKQISFMLETCRFLVYVPVLPDVDVSEATGSGSLAIAGVEIDPRCQSALEISGNPNPSTTPLVEIPRNPLWKGIHGDENSCFMDSLLMAWLCNTKSRLAFFSILENSQMRFEGGEREDEVREVMGAIKVISDQLTNTDYCEKSIVWDLRNKLSKHNPNIKGEMLDVTEFINILFGRSLAASHFITYLPRNSLVQAQSAKGIGSYLHQIIIGPVDRSQTVDVETLLRRSMRSQGIRFKVHPEPFLIIKLPLSNGKLVGVDYVLPNLVLNITCKAEDSNSVAEYELAAVICLEHMHYTAFIRQDEDNWIHFDSMSPNLSGPEVRLLPGFTTYLKGVPNSDITIPEVNKVVQKACLYMFTRTQKVHKSHQDTTLALSREQNKNILQSKRPISHEPALQTECTETDCENTQESSEAQSSVSNVDLMIFEKETDISEMNSLPEVPPPRLVEILDSLLYIMHSCPVEFTQILRKIREKLIENGIHKSIDQVISTSDVVKCIDLSRETSTDSCRHVSAVWNKLAQLAGVDTKDGSCIELCVDESSYSLSNLYTNLGTREDSSFGLIFSLQRKNNRRKPVFINCHVSTTVLNVTRTLSLTSVVCLHEETGIITYVFDPQQKCWTKRLPSGNVQPLFLKTAIAGCYLEFEDSTQGFYDTEMVENCSICAFYV